MATKSLPSEDAEQIAVVQWCEWNGLLAIHVPNGMNTNAITGARFKKLGVRAGTPDLIILGESGLLVWIEMKRRKGGTVSPQQKAMIVELERRGQRVFIAKGGKEAVEYLKRLIQ